MYPDRETFERMVAGIPDLTTAGRETLLVLFGGPLRLRQILGEVNARTAASGKTGGEISESALRKRLEVLIGRGIVARTGSERIKPYYYIRRQWIFSNYILAKCRDSPDTGLLDLTILLHDISRRNREGGPALPHPRFIAALGERTERGHEVVAGYASFRRQLGDSTAIDNYLEGIYADIYDNRVPSSDIDSQLARDFLRFVAVAPAEESGVRIFFWYALFFQTLDMHQESLATFDRGMDLARELGLNTAAILAPTRISRAAILLYLNDLAGAKNAFLDQYHAAGADTSAKARNLLGAGEVELLLAGSDLSPVLGRFTRAQSLCSGSGPDGNDLDTLELRGDIHRRIGTVHRVAGRLDEAESALSAAEDAYTRGEVFRGLSWLLLEQGELRRARAFASAGAERAKHLAGAAALYEKAKAAFQRIRNIRGFAHALAGECELARLAYQLEGTPLPADLETKFDNAFEIYCQINSRLGITRLFITEALLYHNAAAQFPDKYADTADKLDQAARFSRELGLAREPALIRRIQDHADPKLEPDPLIFI